MSESKDLTLNKHHAVYCLLALVVFSFWSSLWNQGELVFHAIILFLLTASGIFFSYYLSKPTALDPKITGVVVGLIVSVANGVMIFQASGGETFSWIIAAYVLTLLFFGIITFIAWGIAHLVNREYTVHTTGAWIVNVLLLGIMMYFAVTLKDFSWEVNALTIIFGLCTLFTQQLMFYTERSEVGFLSFDYKVDFLAFFSFLMYGFYVLMGTFASKLGAEGAYYCRWIFGPCIGGWFLLALYTWLRYPLERIAAIEYETLWNERANRRHNS